MAEILTTKNTPISLDESKQAARSGTPEPEPAKHSGGRSLGTFFIGVLFLVALILLIWIIISLFKSNSGIDAILPFLDKTETKELIF